MLCSDVNSCSDSSSVIHHLLTGFVTVMLVVVMAGQLAWPIPAEYIEPTSTGYRIDINHADATMLALLPGIGLSLGQRIVQYRRFHGSFEQVDQLKDVPGVGPGKFRRLHAWVRCPEPAD